MAPVNEVAGGVAVKQPMARGDDLREHLAGVLREAAEQATFHRREAERWERVGRAAGAGIVQLDAAEPVAHVTPDELVERAGLAYGEDQPEPSRC